MDTHLDYAQFHAKTIKLPLLTLTLPHEMQGQEHLIDSR